MKKKMKLWERFGAALLGAFDGAELGWRYGTDVALVSPEAHFENDPDTTTATGGAIPSTVGGKGAQAPAREENDKNEAATREDLNEEYRAFLARARAER